MFKCGDSKHVESFKCPARRFQCKTCNKCGHFTSFCYKKQSSLKSRNPKAHQLQVGVVYAQEDSICGQSGDLTSSNESVCFQVRIWYAQSNTKFPTPHHLITNVTYRLVFQDPDCKKLAPSKFEIGTYTTNTVKLVGSCMVYLVHPHTKYLLEVIFYVANNNGSVLLSCVTTLACGLIQPCTRLDDLPPRASLITSSADHPKKTKSKISVHVSKKESEMSNHEGMVSKLITSK